MQIFNKRWLVLAALWITSSLAFAAMEERPAVETGSYLNGGVGIDGRQAMHAERKHYNLRLAFAQARSGEYLAGVTVTIRQQGSHEAPVRYEDSGPLFYARLAPGRYHITAEYEGKKRELSTTLTATGSDQVIYWP